MEEQKHDRLEMAAESDSMVTIWTRTGSFGIRFMFFTRIQPKAYTCTGYINRTRTAPRGAKTMLQYNQHHPKRLQMAGSYSKIKVPTFKPTSRSSFSLPVDMT